MKVHKEWSCEDQLSHKLKSVKSFGTLNIQKDWDFLSKEYYIMCKKMCTKTTW